MSETICACPPEARQHSGWMHRDGPPPAPWLDTPIEITVCLRCRRLWRSDGLPHDEAANDAAWKAFRASAPPGTPRWVLYGIGDCQDAIKAREAAKRGETQALPL